MIMISRQVMSELGGGGEDWKFGLHVAAPRVNFDLLQCFHFCRMGFDNVPMTLDVTIELRCSFNAGKFHVHIHI